MAAPVYILEGTWWSNDEVPKILPYFQALEGSHGRIDLSHRTVRCGDDIGYWVRSIPKGAGAMLYIACHGQDLNLVPADGRSPIKREELIEQLNGAKEGAIDFLHFSCCEMVNPARRRESLLELATPCGARWVSGYTRSVDWLRSTLLDLALVSELFVPYHKALSQDRIPRLSLRGHSFLEEYEQLARTLGFSGLSRNQAGDEFLIPERLRSSA